jgi:hypothetical protein
MNGAAVRVALALLCLETSELSVKVLQPFNRHPGINPRGLKKLPDLATNAKKTNNEQPTCRVETTYETNDV